MLIKLTLQLKCLTISYKRKFKIMIKKIIITFTLLSICLCCLSCDALTNEDDETSQQYNIEEELNTLKKVTKLVKI